MINNRILVCGSRTWDNEKIVREYLEDFYYLDAPLCHGAARGADRIAGGVARELGFVVEEYPVDQSLDGAWPAAGHRRNRMMFDSFKPTLVLAFRMPGKSNGTDGMTSYAVKNKCTTWVIDRSGNWLKL